MKAASNLKSSVHGSASSPKPSHALSAGSGKNEVRVTVIDTASPLQRLADDRRRHFAMFR